MSTLLAEDGEMTLDADGWAWTRRDDGWAVPSAGEGNREIRVIPTDGGARLDAVLIEWDEAAAESREALTLFLKRAERDVPGVGSSLDGTLARLAANVPLRTSVVASVRQPFAADFAPFPLNVL